MREDQEFLSTVDELIAEAPLTGAVFQEDARQVYHILKAACLGTNGWEWIKEFDRMENGHIAHQALQNHYSGPGFTEARISMAKKIIDGAHYKNEQVFPFESFVTKLNGAYQTLEECGHSKPEAEKVDDLIEKVQCTEADIRSALMNICMDPVARNNFTIACNKLLEVVNITFKSLFVQGKKWHYVASATETNKHFQRGGGGHGHSFQGRGHGYGQGFGRGHGGRGYSGGYGGHGGHGGCGGRYQTWQTYDDPETGLTYILEFHEGLWFGSKLKNSLWNPNQSRAFGLSVCDDPFDPNHELGFYDPVSDMSVPLEMDSVAFLKTRVPSIE